ncbi:hypothetical protein OsJ_20978 [Oryza sativa Japonica Group]|uniref:Uncharacterized protein n=1 Tax=Oryza sativa subsp. japonica TaxID=39947 RepID=B9FSR6_ORYSJ|nr:hypothetical protein OsJ_20978 [Oryza sativa Japonica Group]
MTPAEFTIGGSQDFYDLSVIDGYNVAMSFSCSSGAGLTCRDNRCRGGRGGIGGSYDGRDAGKEAATPRGCPTIDRWTKMSGLARKLNKSI